MRSQGVISALEGQVHRLEALEVLEESELRLEEGLGSLFQNEQMSPCIIQQVNKSLNADTTAHGRL